MDLHDLEHNTRDGLHIASLAGTWIALVAGFGGMRDHGTAWRSRRGCRRSCPAWRSACASGAARLRVEVTDAVATYTVRDGVGIPSNTTARASTSSPASR